MVRMSNYIPPFYYSCHNPDIRSATLYYKNGPQMGLQLQALLKLSDLLSRYVTYWQALPKTNIALMQIPEICCEDQNIEIMSVT